MNGLGLAVKPNPVIGTDWKSLLRRAGKYAGHLGTHLRWVVRP